MGLLGRHALMLLGAAGGQANLPSYGPVMARLLTNEQLYATTTSD